ncbi:hypothetical protein [Aureimonas altamirensis]|uniref:hypothetical protein n=1 Tax=Aureimonas altamirensis TaxID=370622 RepID=UPI0030167D19
MRMQEARLERQAREVEQLRRRLMFELLVLERLRQRSNPGAPAVSESKLMTMHEILRRAEARAARRLLSDCPESLSAQACDR